MLKYVLGSYWVELKYLLHTDIYGGGGGGGGGAVGNMGIVVAGGELEKDLYLI